MIHRTTRSLKDTKCKNRTKISEEPLRKLSKTSRTGLSLRDSMLKWFVRDWRKLKNDAFVISNTPLLVSEFDFRPELLQWVKKHHEHSMYHEGNSSSAGWHSEYNLHEQQSFLSHSLLIYAHIAHQMRQLSDAPFYIDSMWASVNKTGDYNYSHTHLGVDFSGVLYLQTPFNCGDIVF